MFVDIDTLNAYGLKIKDDTADDNSKTIDSLVANHEREYLDMCLSISLSDVLTDLTKGDARFLKLINQVAFTDVNDVERRSIGLDKGANYYIYSLWVLKQFEDVTGSGNTVLSPENSTRIDPNIYFAKVHDMAADASKMCVKIINDNIADYPEYTEAKKLSRISYLNL